MIRCRFCNTGIDVHQAVQGGICAAEECRRRKLNEDIRQREDQRKKAESKHTATLSARVKVLSAGHPNIGKISADQSLAVVILPSNRHPPTRLGRDRKAKFLAHLNRVIDQFEASEPGKMDLRDARIVHGEESDEINNQACGTCRGHCCLRGGDHAFITQSTILRYRLRNPGSKRQNIIDDYLSNLGEEISEGGCVYQGTKGCSLPRSMRSNVCNTYSCAGLKSMYRKVKKSPSEALAMAACRGDEIDRIQIFLKLA